MTTRKKTPKIEALDPTVVSEVFTRRVAVLASTSMTSQQIATELGMSKADIESIQKGELYKSYVTKMGEQELIFALAGLKTKLARLGEQATKVYAKVLNDYLEGKGGARDAVTVAQSITRALGADKSSDRPNDGSLTVILPSGISEPQPYTIEVKNEAE